MPTNGTALAPANELALTISNPRVQSLSKQFHWRPETLITRITQALPSLVEQQFYLSLGEEFHLRPESFRTLIRMLLGERELTEADIKDKVVGKNLVVNRVYDVAQFLENALFLAGKLSIVSSHINLSMKQAAKLSLLYGSHAEAIIELIVANIEEVGEKMGIVGSDQRITAVALARLIQHAEKNSRTHLDPASYEDLFEILLNKADSEVYAEHSASEEE